MKEGFNKSTLFNVTHANGSQEVIFFKSNPHFKNADITKKIPK